MAWQDQGRQKHGEFGHGTSPHKPRASGKPSVAEALAQDNVHRLARIITSEAGGTTLPAMQAVGWTVINRMQRNHTGTVRDVEKGYAHGTEEHSIPTQVAQDILDRRVPDPTKGATHFYTPDSMPKEGDPTDHKDVGGGLESVPDVTRDNQPIKSYAPSWAADGRFAAVPVPSVPEHLFKFYRPIGNGRVR